jgi:D-amino-acid oxidase
MVMTKPEVVVIGAGVSGLSCGVRLLEKQFEVTIITHALPLNTTSAAAGAYWYGYVDGRARQWSQASLEEFLRLISSGIPGVALRKLREVFLHPVDDPWFRPLLPSFERVFPEDLPSRYADGYIMEVPLVTPPVYLDYLMNRFVKLGGCIEQHAVGNLSELVKSERIIVNCSGVWARYIANDPLVYPLRGQTVIVKIPHLQEGLIDDSEFTYILPRSDGCVLGGVAQKDNWSLEVDPALTENILRRCERFEPSVRGAEIIGHTVGLRPGRHEVRLERERVTERCAVIHNYGHGAVGFTLSWGCAEEVAGLAEQVSHEWRS